MLWSSAHPRPTSRDGDPKPVIVVEVLSPSTVADDHGIRLDGYFSLPCVEHYLIVDADRPVLAQTRASERAIETRPARFGQVADALLEAKSHEWRNQKHCEQWRIALAETAAALRARQEDEIDTEAVLAVPKPIWLDKAETASRMRGRIEAGLDYAKQRFVIWPTDRCARD